MLALALLLSCSEPVGPVPLMDLDGGFFDYPWPDDARRTELDTLDLTGFPNPNDVPLLDTYIDLVAEQRGFGLNGPIYIRFDGPLDTDLLPEPAESRAVGSPLLLLDVDPTSPHWGEAHPITWSFSEDAGTYTPSNLLSVTPVPGFPLRPHTTYALVVSTDVAQPQPELAEVWDPTHPDHTRYLSLRDAVVPYGLLPQDIAVTALFTTDDPLAELASIAQYIDEGIGADPVSQDLSFKASNGFFRTFTGRFDMPLFQHGERPYATEGGGFEFRDDGMPLIHSWEHVRLGVTTPLDLSDPPPDGFPVVIYAHGTGGDYLSHASDTTGLGPGSQMAKAGIVAIGFDQPLHGERATPSTNPEVHSFNYTNPEAARANFRQGAVDILYLAHALSTQDVVFHTEYGDVPLDTSRIGFYGHSHGALTGGLALPWMGAWIDGAVLSAGGGLLTLTVLDRETPVNIAELLRAILGLDEDEVLDAYHPALALMQQIVDITDPINYGPYAFAEDPEWSRARPVSLLLTNGTEDAMTPSRAAEALAVASRLPVRAPEVHWPESFDLRGLPLSDAPLEANAPAWDGTDVTAAFSQWEGGSHWVVTEESEPGIMVREFLKSALAGEPRIE